MCVHKCEESLKSRKETKSGEEETLRRELKTKPLDEVERDLGRYCKQCGKQMWEEVEGQEILVNSISSPKNAVMISQILY